MDHDGEHGELPAAARQFLPPAGDSLGHRPGDLQMGRVGHHRDRDRAAVRRTEGAGGTDVILHVARPLRGPDVDRVLELLEDLRAGLADDVGEDVQPSPVGHADDGLPGAQPCGAAQQGVEQDDRRLPALQRVPLLADVLGVQEGLERLGGAQPLQDVQALRAGGARLRTLDAPLYPQPLARVLDVHVLDPGGTAVRGAQRPDHLAQRHLRPPGETVDGQAPLRVTGVQAVPRRLQFRTVHRRLRAHRVGGGGQVPADPVRVDQRRDAYRLHRQAGIGLRRGPGVPPGGVRVLGGGDAEELPPGQVDRVGIAQVLLPPLVDEPLVDAELRPLRDGGGTG